MFTEIKLQQLLPSLTKFGKSSGALFSFCIRLFCSNNRFSSYGFLLFVFPSEDKVGKTLVETKTSSMNFLLNASLECNMPIPCALSIQILIITRNPKCWMVLSRNYAKCRQSTCQTLTGYPSISDLCSHELTVSSEKREFFAWNKRRLLQEY